MYRQVFFQQQVFIYSRPIAGVRAKMEHETTFTNIKMACEEHIYALRF